MNVIEVVIMIFAVVSFLMVAGVFFRDFTEREIDESKSKYRYWKYLGRYK